MAAPFPRANKRNQRYPDHVVAAVLYEYLNHRTAPVELAKKYNVRLATVHNWIYVSSRSVDPAPWPAHLPLPSAKGTPSEA